MIHNKKSGCFFVLVPILLHYRVTQNITPSYVPLDGTTLINVTKNILIINVLS